MAPDLPPGLVDQLREHAASCEALAAPLYGVLLRGMADDLAAHPTTALTTSPTAAVFDGWQGPVRQGAVALRLLGGLHRLVLRGQLPELAPYYRSVGGNRAPDGAWPPARAALAAHTGELRAQLAVPPQTNEPGRAVALAVGLSVAAERSGLSRVRLLEIGASGGLNLWVDAFRIAAEPDGADDDAGWWWGPAGSPVDLTGAVRGRPPRGAVQILERAGCDREPIRVDTEEGRLRLESFVWPDQVERFARLVGALEVAAAAGHPPLVERAGAAQWLADRLSARPEPEVLTVVWHSVMWQYLDDAERRRVTGALTSARHRMPLAHLALEPDAEVYRDRMWLTLDGERLGHAPAHGVPFTVTGKGAG